MGGSCSNDNGVETCTSGGIGAVFNTIDHIADVAEQDKVEFNLNPGQTKTLYGSNLKGNCDDSNYEVTYTAYKGFYGDCTNHRDYGYETGTCGYYCLSEDACDATFVVTNTDPASNSLLQDYIKCTFWVTGSLLNY